MSEGTKGPRCFDWASVPILHRWEDDGRHLLLIRRSLTDPQEKRYSFVFAPPGTTLQEMVQAIGAGFHIEEDFENAKDLGLDHYEVRSFLGWYRHVTLVLVAHARLSGICANARDSTTSLRGSRSPRDPLDASSTGHPVLPLTIVSRASSPRTAHLAPSSEPATGPGLVLVASLPPKCCQLLPHQTSSEGRLILAYSYPPLALLPTVLFPDFPEGSWKCRSSRKVAFPFGSCCLLSCLSSKGVLIMAPLPLADCARMLGIHPKTLPHWLTQANVPFTAHPTDAHIKCVTEEQLKPGGEIAWPSAPAPSLACAPRRSLCTAFVSGTGYTLAGKGGGALSHC